jgi:hypothetical protein
MNEVAWPTGRLIHDYKVGSVVFGRAMTAMGEKSPAKAQVVNFSFKVFLVDY